MIERICIRGQMVLCFFAALISFSILIACVKLGSASDDAPDSLASGINRRFKRSISNYSDDQKWRCPEVSPTLCFYASNDYGCHSHDDCPQGQLCCLFACSYGCARPVPVYRAVVEHFYYDEVYDEANTIKIDTVVKSRSLPSVQSSHATSSPDPETTTENSGALTNASFTETTSEIAFTTDFLTTTKKHPEFRNADHEEEDKAGDFHGIILLQTRSKSGDSETGNKQIYKSEDFEDFNGVFKLVTKSDESSESNDDETADSNSKTKQIYKSQKFEDFKGVFKLGTKTESSTSKPSNVYFRNYNLIYKLMPESESSSDVSNDENVPSNSKTKEIYKKKEFGDFNGVFKLVTKSDSKADESNESSKESDDEKASLSKTKQLYQNQKFDDFKGVFKLVTKSESGTDSNESSETSNNQSDDEKASLSKTKQLYKNQKFDDFKGVFKLVTKSESSTDSNESSEISNNQKISSNSKSKFKEHEFRNFQAVFRLRQNSEFGSVSNVQSNNKNVSANSESKQIYQKKEFEDLNSVFKLVTKSESSTDSNEPLETTNNQKVSSNSKSKYKEHELRLRQNEESSSVLNKLSNNKNVSPNSKSKQIYQKREFEDFDSVFKLVTKSESSIDSNESSEISNHQKVSSNSKSKFKEHEFRLRQNLNSISDSNELSNNKNVSTNSESKQIYQKKEFADFDSVFKLVTKSEANNVENQSPNQSKKQNVPSNIKMQQGIDNLYKTIPLKSESALSTTTAPSQDKDNNQDLMHFHGVLKLMTNYQ